MKKNWSVCLCMSEGRSEEYVEIVTKRKGGRTCKDYLGNTFLGFFSSHVDESAVII